MKEHFEKLKGIVEGIEEDVVKFNEQGNKSAGMRVRKAMQELKAVAQDIRKHILDKKNGVM